MAQIKPVLDLVGSRPGDAGFHEDADLMLIFLGEVRVAAHRRSSFLVEWTMCRCCCTLSTATQSELHFGVEFK